MSVRVALPALKGLSPPTSSLHSSSLYSATPGMAEVQQVPGALPAPAKVQRARGGFSARGVRARLKSAPCWHTPLQIPSTHVVKGKQEKRVEWTKREKEQFNREIFLFFSKSLSTGCTASLLKNFAHSCFSPSLESTHHINIILLQASLLQWINQVSQK